MATLHPGNFTSANPSVYTADRFTNGNTSLTTGNTGLDPFARFLPFFGPPPKPYLRAYDRHDVQHEVLPEAYEGDNFMLREMIITNIKAADEWLFRELAPLRDWKGKMTIR